VIYALMIFITLGDGQFAMSPVEYHFTADACGHARDVSAPVIEHLRDENGWREAYLRCIPIPPAANLPSA